MCSYLSLLCIISPKRRAFVSSCLLYLSIFLRRVPPDMLLKSSCLAASYHADFCRVICVGFFCRSLIWRQVICLLVSRISKRVKEKSSLQGVVGRHVRNPLDVKKKRLIRFHPSEVMGSDMVGKSFSSVAAKAASMFVVSTHFCHRCSMFKLTLI